MNCVVPSGSETAPGEPLPDDPDAMLSPPAFQRTTTLTIPAKLGTIHVDPNVKDPRRDGESWATAVADLNTALAMIASNPPQRYRLIKLAQGTYYPDSGTGDPNQSFVIPSGVTIYGGYAGDGAANPDLRDPELHPTILSGDIGSPDVAGDNSRTVIVASDTASRTLLSGVTVEHGFGAFGGGGLFATDGHLRVENCVFRNHEASLGGAVMFDGASTAEFVDCTFENNVATNGGGGAAYATALSHPIFRNCKFVGNSAFGDSFFHLSRGGAILSSFALDVEGCLFSGNTLHGLVSQEGGAIAMNGGTVDLRVVNSTFFHNTAFNAGAISVTGFLSEVEMANSIVWANTSPPLIGVFGDDVSFSIIQGDSNGDNDNLNSDPLFLDPDGIDDVIGTADDNPQFAPASPALETGNNNVVNRLLDEDVFGQPRFLDGEGDGIDVIDRGAWEAPDDYRTCHVDFEEYGVGLAGSNGVPHLYGIEGSCDPLGHFVVLDNARPNSLSIWWFDDDSADLAFNGGRLLVDPTPPNFIFAIPIGETGSLFIPGQDLNPFEGAAFYMQFLINDPNTPKDMSMSNGLLMHPR